MEEKIKIGNKLIAEFMGYIYFECSVRMDVGDCCKDWQDVDVYSKVPIEVDDYPKDSQKYFKELPNPDFGNENSTRWASDIEKLGWDTLNFNEYITDLKYHSCWDELMPVLDKIENISVTNICEVCTTHIRIDNFLIDLKLKPCSKIEAAWIAVVEFIKRRNKKIKND